MGTTLANDEILYEMKFHALQTTVVDNICFLDDFNFVPFEITYFSPNGGWGDVIQGSFTGLGCGFAWAKTAAGYTITGINDAPYNTLNVKSYPNPTNDMLHFNLAQIEASDVRIELFDLQGKKVQQLEKTLPNNTKILDMTIETLTAGTYLYRLTTKAGVATGKFTKI